MTDYGSIAAAASADITEAGAGGTATFTSRTVGTYDPITDTDSGESSTSVTVPCVVLPVSQSDIATSAGNLTISEAIKILVSGQNFPAGPRPGDRVTVPGRSGNFAVEDVKLLAPDGTPVLWTILAGRKD